ncbi:MAG: hypothetical protein ACP5N1_04445 [Candidatus Woesearchaeota archaeon]
MKLHLKTRTEISRDRAIPKNKTNNIKRKETYKEGLMEINKEEDKYDRLFEQKLAAQYREFKRIKEYKIQSVKFMRIVVIIATIIILALLLITYG